MLGKCFLSSLDLIKGGAVVITGGETSFSSCNLSDNHAVSENSIWNHMHFVGGRCECLCADTCANQCCVTVHCHPLHRGGIMCACVCRWSA